MLGFIIYFVGFCLICGIAEAILSGIGAIFDGFSSAAVNYRRHNRSMAHENQGVRYLYQRAKVVSKAVGKAIGKIN
jgi:hypothetical protein